MQTNLISFIPALPLLGFILNGGYALWVARGGSRSLEKPLAWLACLFPLGAFVLSVCLFLTLAGVSGEKVLTQSLFTWMATGLFHASFAFMVDPLSSVMLLVVTGVGSLIHFYSLGYMKGDAGFNRYFSYLNLFLFFMLLLILGDNLLVLFVGWEGVGLCSYLLIGFWFTDIQKARCGKKAFIVNRIGDFGFLVGLFFILYAFNTQSQASDPRFFDFSFMLAHKEIFTPYVLVITLCLFFGATGKSAQIPLYIWLPDAMAGPTPVSALIHAATMVTAGVYMVARLFFLYAMAPLTLEIIAGIGLGTAILAAIIALAQNDIKKVLAYSTVSQLGYMFLALGVGAPQTAVFHVVTHAFFKACLFLCAGSVIHALHHEQDIRKMGGLARTMPSTCLAFFLSTLAIAGIPPLAGFFSKDEILFHTYLHAPNIVYLLALLTAGLTAFYMFRLFAKVFLGSKRGGAPGQVPLIMRVPVLILAFLAVVGGLVGVPDVLGGHNTFFHWLEYLHPQTHEVLVSPARELGLMAISTAWAFVMGGLSLYLYARHPNWTENLKKRLQGLYQLVQHKFFVDEIYHGCIVSPLVKLSRTLLWKGSDEQLIDGFLVHGWSDVANLGARFVSRLQTGLLGHYLMTMGVGLGCLIAYFVFYL